MRRMMFLCLCFLVCVSGCGARQNGEGKTDEEQVRAGVEALADFIKEIGLPTTLRELGVRESTDLKTIADSCNLASGGYRKMTHEEILDIFQECY